MSPECATAPSATLTAGTSPSRFQKAWTAIKTPVVAFVSHALNSDDPIVDLDALAFCVLFPFSIYWLQIKPHIDGNWAAAFATIWAAVKLSNFRRRPGGDQ